jgi:hypothetical protein
MPAALSSRPTKTNKHSAVHANIQAEGNLPARRSTHPEEPEQAQYTSEALNSTTISKNHLANRTDPLLATTLRYLAGGLGENQVPMGCLSRWEPGTEEPGRPILLQKGGSTSMPCLLHVCATLKRSRRSCRR